MIGSFEGNIFVIKPIEVAVDIPITSEDLALSDKELVENIIEPAIHNILGALDAERPHAKTGIRGWLRDIDHDFLRNQEQARTAVAGKP